MKIIYYKNNKEFEEAFESYIRGFFQYKKTHAPCGHRGSKAVIFETMRGLEMIVKCKKCYDEEKSNKNKKHENL